MKILVDYDPFSGNINSEDGNYLGCQLGLEKHEAKTDSKMQSLIELKKAGFSTDEIIQLDQRGLI